MAAEDPGIILFFYFRIVRAERWSAEKWKIYLVSFPYISGVNFSAHKFSCVGILYDLPNGMRSRGWFVRRRM